MTMSGGWSPEWLIAVSAAFGFGVGCLLVWAGGLAQRRHWAKRQADDEAKLADRQNRLEEAIRALAAAETRAAKNTAMEQELQQAREALAKLRAEQAASQAAMREREAGLEKKIGELTKLRGEMARDFETLAINVLKSSQSSFLALANETLQKHRSSAEADLQRRSEAIQNLVKPVEETLKRYESNLQALERARQEAYGALSNELKNVVATQSAVRAETSRLVNALRAAPKTRGRWGEQQLQNIMELSGMTEHVDFI
ncbi:MAG: DNA recombination protein RmuC, partial [Alphaproteobacteria bacterium]